ncbi:hypothetical protein WMY93_020906 [Mugilogobius chulae]|uniref:Alkylated DNA repair protein AlkB homologue 8 N-terminal domain-containing protein n=1 Tax=Mugilogobius chulae TaxID=88201 RepID=A0AAW0NDG8_9GOBI
MVVDFRHQPLFIGKDLVERVQSFKILEVTVTEDLSWGDHISKAVGKAQQRLYYLRKLKSAHISRPLMVNFYNCATSSILTYGFLVWFSSCSKADQQALQRVVTCGTNTTPLTTCSTCCPQGEGGAASSSDHRAAGGVVSPVDLTDLLGWPRIKHTDVGRQYWFFPGGGSNAPLPLVFILNAADEEPLASSLFFPPPDASLSPQPYILSSVFPFLPWRHLCLLSSLLTLRLSRLLSCGALSPSLTVSSLLSLMSSLVSPQPDCLLSPDLTVSSLLSLMSSLVSPQPDCLLSPESYVLSRLSSALAWSPDPVSQLHVQDAAEGASEAAEDGSLHGAGQLPALARSHPSENTTLHVRTDPTFPQGESLHHRRIQSPPAVQALPQEHLHLSNETVNIWSHLLGFLLFFSLAVHDLCAVLPSSGANREDYVIYAIGLFCFQVCMLCSVGYHLFSCHRSEKTCRRWLSLDYAGISVGILGCYVPGIFYAFYCDAFWRQVYLVTVLSLILAVFCAQVHPRYLSNDWKRIRMGLFCCVAGVSVVPACHWVCLTDGLASDIVQLFLPRVLIMYLIAASAFLFYVTKIPERYFPGQLNYLGASHQVWHVWWC